MTKFSNLKEGAILGESQYYTVEKIKGDKVQLLPDGGTSIVVDKAYVENYLHSADQFTKEEKLTKTQLAELFINSPRLAMTVAFFKQDKPKSKKQYKEDLATQAEKIKNDFMKKGISAIEEALMEPVLTYIPGELRIMRGRHYGEVDELGRIQFTDMDITTGHNARQVDPRTIQWVIVNDVKYTFK